jgi:flagellum-specific peptidoglycan hydrolase FlgJ
MSPVARPRWQQMTALVSLSTGGALTGFSFVPGSLAHLTTPTSMPIRLMALAKSAQPQAGARSTASDDALLRSAIVNVAQYYLRMAENKTPAEMEAIIWQHDSLDGADHGPSCAAFASLTLELGAQVVGQQSWVTGGTTYPWPLHSWADVRVDPNPASPQITSVLQDAEANQRWHPLGDGYTPRPGDWVLFDGHVEVVTQYAGGTLSTIGGDSLPNFSVNAHEYRGPLVAQGVVGFVDNGALPVAATQPAASPAPATASAQPDAHAGNQATQSLAAIPGAAQAATPQPAPAGSAGGAAIPATPVTGAGPGTGTAPGTATRAGAAPNAGAPPVAAPGSGHYRRAALRRRPGRDHVAPARQRSGQGASPGADVPGTGPSWPAATSSPATAGPGAAQGAAAVPGAPAATHTPSAAAKAPAAAPSSDSGSAAPAATQAQQAFIAAIAPGAMATQAKYGVPAAVTIAQAIEESGWGQSGLAVNDHNLFGIKGTGPAGSDSLPTQEFQNGQMVTRIAIFRVYHNFAESIDDHGRLLATSGYYRQAMAERQAPNKFAQSLTGVYATDPDYGSKLISLMQQYDLYRYDSAAPAAATPATPATSAAPTGQASIPGLASTAPIAPQTAQTAPPAPAARRPPPARPAGTPQPTGPAHTPEPARTPHPGPSAPTRQPVRPEPSPQPAPSPSPAWQPGQPTLAASLRSSAVPQAETASVVRMSAPAGHPLRSAVLRAAGLPAAHYHHHHLPLAVSNAFLESARGPILNAKHLYHDVARHHGVRWEFLAACDWMQCEARPRYSPVHGEKLGAVNPRGSVYRTKSEALEQCAYELIELALTIYQIDLTAQAFLAVPDLANVFAAFRWGDLLKQHRTSAMEFPYSVAGLTEQHLRMHWPNIDDPRAPDKPGTRFRRPFGAVPVMLALHYPAIA